MTPLRRYVGITDFTTPEQAIAMRDVLANTCEHMHTPPDLMVGVMMNYESLWGISAKWTEVFPKKETLPKIFAPRETQGILNTLHYADYKRRSGDRERNMTRSIEKGLRYAGNNLHAIQLDLTWPDPIEICFAISTLEQPLHVILQIGRQAFKEAKHHPSEVAERLHKYDGIIHGVLIDKSMGEGRLIEPNHLIVYIEEIRRINPNLHIAVAGGLDDQNLDILVPLLKMFPNLSIDAQSRLRPSGDPADPIDWKIAKNYLINAGSLFAKYEK